MERLLGRRGDMEFWCSDTFHPTMLLPILHNLEAKTSEGWDDYNEAYHCCRLIESVRRDPELTMEFHTIRKGGEVLGVSLMTRGNILQPLFFPADLAPQESPDGLLVFNYFHIAPQGRGNGRFWLREILLPHYQKQGFQAVYVKSSHPRSFSLYASLGKQVGAYTSHSDNGLHTRTGVLFRIPL